MKPYKGNISDLEFAIASEEPTMAGNRILLHPSVDMWWLNNDSVMTEEMEKNLGLYRPFYVFSHQVLRIASKLSSEEAFIWRGGYAE